VPVGKCLTNQSNTAFPQLGSGIARILMVLLVSCLAVSCDAQNQQDTSSSSPIVQQPTEAWWLQAVFPVNNTGYGSLKAQDINPAWTKMSVLSYGSLPAEAASDLSWMHKDGFMFETEDFFRRPGVTDKEICGVFEDKSGRQGRFLLVLEKSGPASWKVAYLHEERGSAGFSIFVRKAGKLYWGTCLQCDEFGQLILKDGKFDLNMAP
jgi:hypothetical protein